MVVPTVLATIASIKDRRGMDGASGGMILLPPRKVISPAVFVVTPELLSNGVGECYNTAMHALVERHSRQLADLCVRHHVRTLEAFGSAVDGRFDADRSDLDFLVDFLPLEPGRHAKAYLGLLLDLEDLFKRRIDLVEASAIANPYFLRSVNRSRTLLYAA